MEEIKNINVQDSGIKVGEIIRLGDKVIYRREMSPQDVVNDIASRINGKLVGFDELYDPKTGRFLSETELSSDKIGATFISLDYEAVITDDKAKSRITKQPNPYRGRIVKKSRYQIIANIDWQTFVNRRGNGQYIAKKYFQNGTLLIENCKAVGITTQDNHTVNGVIFQSLEPTKYFVDGKEIAKSVLAEFLTDTTKSDKTQADKMGIDVRFMPHFRTTAVENCNWVRGLGFEYVPIKS